jgi:hypothetical protein
MRGSQAAFAAAKAPTMSFPAIFASLLLTFSHFSSFASLFSSLGHFFSFPRHPDTSLFISSLFPLHFPLCLGYFCPFSFGNMASFRLVFGSITELVVSFGSFTWLYTTIHHLYCVIAYGPLLFPFVFFFPSSVLGGATQPLS